MSDPVRVSAIECDAVTKAYGDLVAVDSVSLRIAPGELVALLGHNGAGKSTLVQLMCGLARPTAGTVRVLGSDISTSGSHARRSIGILRQNNTLDEELSVYENVYMYARLFGLSRARAHAVSERLIAEEGLLERADARSETLSGGMKRRLAFTRALVNEPRILILDEPTVGMDFESKERLWRRLSRLQAEGVSVVVVTHDVGEVAAICGRVVVMSGGRILADERPTAFIDRQLGCRRVSVMRRLDGGPPTPEHWREASDHGPVVEQNRALVMLRTLSAQDSDEIIARMGDIALEVRPATLADAYQILAGSQLEP